MEQENNQRHIEDFAAVLAGEHILTLADLPRTHRPSVLEQNSYDSIDPNIIKQWIEYCQNTPGSLKNSLGLRQLSGAHIDSNDYGDYFFSATRRCSMIFKAYIGALEIMGWPKNEDNPDNPDNPKPKEPTKTNWDAMLAAWKNPGFDFLEYSDPIKKAQAIVYEFDKEHHIRNYRSLYNAWQYLEYARSLTARINRGHAIAIHNQTLLAPFILSHHQTQEYVAAIKDELSELKQYVKKYIINKPEFHERAWKMYIGWINHIKRFLQPEFHVSEENTKLWASIISQEPRWKPTKSARSK